MIRKAQGALVDRKITDTFSYCPSCGEKSSTVGSNPFECSACRFTFHFGPVAAVGGIVVNDDGAVLLVRRARDPGKGKCGLPGGFVDAGESLEKALAREIQEEVGLQVTDMKYLTSYPNLYAYRGVIAPVADVFYSCKAHDFGGVETQAGEIDAFSIVQPREIDLDQMAFESNRNALKWYIAHEI